MAVFAFAVTPHPHIIALAILCQIKPLKCSRYDAMACYVWWYKVQHTESSLIARFMGPTWGPSGADRTQVGPMLDPWTLLSGIFLLWQITSLQRDMGVMGSLFTGNSTFYSTSLFWTVINDLIKVASCGHHDVSNTRQRDCLFNKLLSLTANKHQISVCL